MTLTTVEMGTFLNQTVIYVERIMKYFNPFLFPPLMGENLTDCSGAVYVSAAHFHPSRETAKKLFGEGYQFNLTPLPELGKHTANGPVGECVTEEKAEIMNPETRAVVFLRMIIKVCEDGSYEFRPRDQVEFSYRELATKFGPEAKEGDFPRLNSGDTEGSRPFSVVKRKNGGVEKLRFSVGCIAVKAHIHMGEKTAEKYAIRSGEEVIITINGKELPAVVKITGKGDMVLAHIDLDQATYVGIPHGKTATFQIVGRVQ